MTSPLRQIGQILSITVLLLVGFCARALPTPKNLGGTAFVAIRSDGSLVSWGSHTSGGVVTYSSMTQTVSSTDGAFSAIKLNEGGVETWGDAANGGDHSVVASLLNSSIVGYGRRVINIQSAQWAFAALRADGSVVAWGDETFGGSVTTNLHHNMDEGLQILSPENISSLFSTAYSFCGLTKQSYLFTWGYAADVTSPVPVTWAEAFERKVVGVASTSNSFASLTVDEKVITWGSSLDKTSRETLSRLYWSGNTVKAIFTTYYAFAVIVEGKNDTRPCSNSSISSNISFVLSWGDASNGGDTDAVCEFLISRENITIDNIYSNPFAFALLKSDGSVITWGNSNSGGDSSTVKGYLQSDVIAIYHTAFAFTALKAGGGVVSWGNMAYGGFIPLETKKSLENMVVVSVKATFTAFAALTSSGRVICWGESPRGGDCNSSYLRSALTDVVNLSSNQEAFAALKIDGSVVCWGFFTSGGDCQFEALTNITHVFTIDDLNSNFDNRPTLSPSRKPSGMPSAAPITRAVWATDESAKCPPQRIAKWLTELSP